MQAGAGRRIGEQTEQLWAKIKAFTQLARYMTRAHFQDGFNMLFDFITTRRQPLAATVLAGRLQRNDKKQGERQLGEPTCTAVLEARTPTPSIMCAVECTMELQTLVSDARDNGVTDLDVALANLVEYERRPADAKTRVEELVELLEKKASIDNIHDNGARHILVQPGNVGLNLNRKANDTDAYSAMNMKINRLESAMGIVVRYTRDHPEYQQGLTLVRERLVRHYQGVLEAQVFKRKRLTQEAEQNLAGKKNSNKIKKSMRAVGE
jgi:hypothetical protein